MTDAEHTIRHSAAHLLAAAVLEVLPTARLGTGPATEQGFYYDFELETPITDAELKQIEKKMKHLIKQNQAFERSEQSIEDAKIWADELGQPFKKETIEKLAEEGETVVSFYQNGHFSDLCAGPHITSTKEIGAIKLTHFSASYWQGDENRESMQRIYGVAFATAAELESYEKMIVEAKKRDHRKLGKELDLFTFSEKIGSGLPLFTPRGTFLREQIANTIQSIQAKYGFEKVSIPHITKKDLYETSGHWDKFKDDLFHVHGKGDTEFVMKPMNCPHHTQIFASQPRSYRDLPIRYAEVTTCYRDEQPGELLGLSRVRALTQDDGHTFCRIDQVKEESRNIVNVIREFYTKLGMFGEGDFWVSLSVRDPATPEKYLGDTDDWDQAEQFLEEIAAEENLDAKRIEGEAAFYGPKLDFQFRDALGREWQLATVQIDFVQPERFELEFTNNEGNKERPVMIHRAIAGSLERFLSVIIEHFAGVFPPWLAPEQARIVPVAGDFNDGCTAIQKTFREAGLRVELDSSNDALGKKVRKAEKMKIPFILVVGENELKDGTVTVRMHGVEEQETMKIDEFIQNMTK